MSTVFNRLCATNFRELVADGLPADTALAVLVTVIADSTPSPHTDGKHMEDIRAIVAEWAAHEGRKLTIISNLPPST